MANLIGMWGASGKRAVFSAVFILAPLFLIEVAEAVPPSPHLRFLPIAYWWEIPAQPPEKWLSPRREEDEWYKRRQMKKHRRGR